jgi:hypothetical protein
MADYVLSGKQRDALCDFLYELARFELLPYADAEIGRINREARALFAALDEMPLSGAVAASGVAARLRTLDVELARWRGQGNDVYTLIEEMRDVLRGSAEALDSSAAAAERCALDELVAAAANLVRPSHTRDALDAYAGARRLRAAVDKFDEVRAGGLQ